MSTYDRVNGWSGPRCLWRVTEDGRARFVLFPAGWAVAKGGELEARP
jgi:hypothetical protein